jgi:hypothetical protein
VAPDYRLPLFFACCAALLAVPFLIGGSGGHSMSGRAKPRPVESPLSTPRASPGLPPVTPAARHFLAAFLRFGVGDTDLGVLKALRGTATPVFAAQLLDGPAPRLIDPGASDPHLGPIAVARLSANPPLVSVSATADRPSGPEQLSFVFALRDSRWLASAPGA